MTSKQSNDVSVPEPVSPEGGNVIHVPRIPGTVNTPVGPMIPKSEPVSPEGAAERLQRAAQSVGVIVVKDKESLASQVEAIRLIRSVIPEVAAPIAPAAEELIQEDLIEACGNLIGTVIVHYPEWNANPLVKPDVCSAVAALTRAKEALACRKGAKNG